MWYFSDYDALTTRSGVLDLGLSAHNHAATTCEQRLLNTLVAVDDTACGEVGTLDIVQQLLALTLGVVDICAAGIYNLAQVVGRHVGSHTYGDTAGTVYEQQRNLCGQYGRLLQCVVEVQAPVDSLLLDIGHNLVGNLLHACLGVTHSRGRVTIHRTEVTLTLNQGVAHRPILRHTHHGLIY